MTRTLIIGCGAFLFCYSTITGALFHQAMERRVKEAELKTLAKVIINLPLDKLTSLNMEDI